MEPRCGTYQGNSPSGPHQLAYVEWGNTDNPRVVICVHGLTRQGRDFDVLANELARDYRVVCPDIVGRGRSAWLQDPTHYNYRQYCADMLALFVHLNLSGIDWVGTSMGGLIGMMLAALPSTPIRRLVMNDIGPLVSKAGQERIAAYVGRAPPFMSEAEAVEYVRGTSAGFGRLSEAEWRALTLPNIRRDPDGYLRLRYDPAIANAFSGRLGDVDMWQVWDQVRCPTLVLHGVESDLLTAATAQEMTRRGPRAGVVDIAACGHAPALMAPKQLALIRDFLLA